jgi:chromosome segregation ATPase
MPRYFDDPGKWEKEEKNKILPALAARSWYLVVPLIAIWWFHSRTVVPAIQAVEQKMLEDRKATELVRNKTLSEARGLGVETSKLRAEADTFSVRSGQYAAVLDSVIAIQQQHITETHRLEVQSDSLRTVLSELDGRSLQYSDSLTRMQAQVDSLRTLIDGHQAEVKRLEEEIAVNRDLADRLKHPEMYRKNTALVTGKGNYPNRDALPKR